MFCFLGLVQCYPGEVVKLLVKLAQVTISLINSRFFKGGGGGGGGSPDHVTQV